MSGAKHSYAPDPGSFPTAMHLDRPCVVCGRSPRLCRRGQQSKLERHRFSFEGATSLLAAHLIDDHGASPLSVSPWCTGVSQGDWVALDDLHKAAHETENEEVVSMSNELREAAQRVTGYVRARALMSNTDPEVISDIAVMPAGTEKPMEFKLLASDLEALALAAVGGTPIEFLPGTVTISAEEYLDLQSDANELAALHASGVDNWEGYAEARSNR